MPPTSITVNSGASQTLEQIGHTSAYSITIGQAAAEFLLTDSDTHILQNPRLRALDGQKLISSSEKSCRLPRAPTQYQPLPLRLPQITSLFICNVVLPNDSTVVCAPVTETRITFVFAASF
ncbi:MAG TPA: hypothetical protein VHU89_08100 [Acidobacteriaceae bacterium]|nr:hypothetical protein [Acidobacteriaceae bacterium]